MLGTGCLVAAQWPFGTQNPQIFGEHVATATNPCIHASCRPGCPKNRAAPPDGAMTAVPLLWSCPSCLLHPPQHTLLTLFHIPQPLHLPPQPVYVAQILSGPSTSSKWDSTEQPHHHLAWPRSLPYRFIIG